MTAVTTRGQLAADIDAGSVTVVDALGGSYYEEQHLPGAISMAPDEVDALAPRLLPHRDAAIVTYCSNVACPNSGQVAHRLEALGYTNVRKYAEGIQDWVEAGLPTESGAAVDA